LRHDGADGSARRVDLGDGDGDGGDGPRRGEACASLADAINRMATVVFFVAPVLVVTGLVGVVVAGLRAIAGWRPAAQVSA